MSAFRPVLALVLGATAALAQTATGVITGTIADPGGAIIANAPLTLKNSQYRHRRRSILQRHRQLQLHPTPRRHLQKLTATVPGFKTYVRNNLAVQAAQTIRVDLVLEVGATQDSITVSAEAAMLSTESAAVNSNVTVDRMNALPILGVGPSTSSTHGVRQSARVFHPLRRSLLGAEHFPCASTARRPTPSASSSTARTSPTASTHRPRQAQTQPSVDALQEVTIQAANYSAEFRPSRLRPHPIHHSLRRQRVPRLGLRLLRERSPLRAPILRSRPQSKSP